MNIQDWIIFSKVGSNLTLTANPLIPLQFTSITGVGAEGFIITDPSENAITTKITNNGYLYDGTISVGYSYLFDSAPVSLTSSDASIITTDVSIFNPNPTNTLTISDVILSPTFSVDLCTNFVYPSVTYSSTVFLKPVSVKLIETEHLFIFQESSLGALSRPYDNINPYLSFKFIGEENQIQFFIVDEDKQEIEWTDEIIFDTSILVADIPLTINIGFRADQEGVYERSLGIYHIIDGEYRTLGEILVTAQAIGEDERFRDLLANFGLPDPKDFSDIFKETDINEDMLDWEILNPKSKHMILEHDKIMPYVGTYKALINALKWLGYDDIYVREWFKNVKENKKISFIVPFDAKDRTQTILMFSPEERKIFKKLNELSLVYCLTRETGEIDNWGTLETENCYSYNIKEIFVKLLALKQWLERNIIGINCRIIDITGEGIYFERYLNLIYTTDNIGYNLNIEQSLTPMTLDKSSELIKGDASICLTIKEIESPTINQYRLRFSDMIYHIYDASTHLTYHYGDPSLLTLDTSNYLINIGAPIAYPVKTLRDIQWKLSVEKPDAGVIGVEQVSNPLFILENEIRFYNILDTSSIFHNVSTNLNLLLEKVYFRDPSIDEWINSIAYSLYPNSSENGYILESSIGDVILFDNYMNLQPEPNAILQYAVDANYKVPLLSANEYFSFIDSSNSKNFFPKTYYLDILDGKIIMDASGNTQYFINFQYDTSLDEQMITLNAVYQSDRMPLFIIDSCAYFYGDPSMHNGGDASVFAIDNAYYCMGINHIGDYNIEVFGWDGYNTPFYNRINSSYNVWIKHPTIYSLIDNCCNISCVSTYMSLDDVSALIAQNTNPLYDRHIPLQGLSLQIDSNGEPYISVPSITYFQDIPESNTLNRFFNMTERVLTIADPVITIDPDFQDFYTGDDIRLVKFDKGKYSLLIEASSHILNATVNTLTLDNIDSNINIDSSSDVYIINDTYRSVKNASNNGSNFLCDVSGYTFGVNQLVGIIVSDGSTGYSWGSSYRVLTVNGSTHTFNAEIPQFFLNNPGRYTIKTKHSYSSYANMTLTTDTATEVNNTFNIYLKDTNCQEYYLDNTFVIINILFDQDQVNKQWYNVSDNLINSEFYYHPEPIVVDVSTLVILKSVYDNSTYLLNQKNIWTVYYNLTDTILMKVYNESVPYVFDTSGYYDVKVESYDSYGNIITKMYEGLIKVGL